MQSFGQISVLMIGVFVFDWSKYLDWYLATLAWAILLNSVCHYVFFAPREGRSFMVSASPLVITSSTFIFVTGYSFSTYFVAVSLAVLSKFIFRLGKSHVFNPSNFGILCMAALGEGLYRESVANIPDPGHWLWWVVPIGTATVILARRYLISYSYLAGFLIFRFLFAPFFAADYLIHVSSLLGIFSMVFVFHMISDPKTTPSAPRSQIFFGLCVALADVLVRLLNLGTPFIAPELALAFVCAMRALFYPQERSAFYRLAPVSAAVLIPAAGMLFGYFPFRDQHTYRLYQAQPAAAKPPFKFVESTASLGLDAEALMKGEKEDLRSSLRDVAFSPSIAIADYDRDGFQDLLVVAGYNTKTKLFRNLSGKGFAEVTARAGLAMENPLKNDFVTAAFFDCDNDGTPDIYGVDRSGRHRVLLNRKGLYSDVTSELGLPRRNTGFARSINVFDYDRDGFLDIVIANFPDFVSGDVTINAGTLIYSGTPKKNYVLRNRGCRVFTDETENLGVISKEFTHAVGVADVNADGYPDLYFANDFGRDAVWLNQDGKNFVDASEKMLGHVFSRAGMNAEFADINGDGFPDAYVSNFSGGWNRHGMNYLWINHEGKSFENQANELDVGRCGFSWGAKFFDADLDGQLDLFVGNGMRSGKNPGWMATNYWSAVPNFLKRKRSVASEFPKQPYLAQNQRSCLFWKKDGRFIDVAEETGITDLDNGISTALIDFDNSGLQSVVVGNNNWPTLHFYQPRPLEKNHWLGFELIGRAPSNRSAYGAKVFLRSSAGTQVRELYPSNGMRSTSDSRLVFGLGKDRPGPLTLEILWPDGKRQLLNDYKLDTYNRIIQP